MKRLEEREASLAQQKAKIKELTGQLNGMLEVYNSSPKGQQLNQISIQYDIAFADSKIAHYSRLRDELQ